MIHCRPEMDWIVSADRLRIASQNLSTTLFKKGNIECVILAPTTMMRSAKEIKTDRRDAEKIAKCLAFNTYKPVYVPTEEARHHLLQEVFSAWQHLPSSDIIAQEGGRVHAAGHRLRQMAGFHSRGFTPYPMFTSDAHNVFAFFRAKSPAFAGLFGYFILLIFATKNPSCSSSGATHSVPGMETGSRGTLSNAASSSGTISAPVLRSTRETISSFS